MLTEDRCVQQLARGDDVGRFAWYRTPAAWSVSTFVATTTLFLLQERELPENAMHYRRQRSLLQPATASTASSSATAATATTAATTDTVPACGSRQIRGNHG